VLDLGASSRKEGVLKGGVDKESTRKIELREFSAQFGKLIGDQVEGGKRSPGLVKTMTLVQRESSKRDFSPLE
jgi:hypothetical protein